MKLPQTNFQTVQLGLLGTMTHIKYVPRFNSEVEFKYIPEVVFKDLSSLQCSRLQLICLFKTMKHL